MTEGRASNWFLMLNLGLGKIRLVSASHLFYMLQQNFYTL